MADLFSYTITIKGRFPGENRPEVIEKLRNGLCMNFPVHESIDELLIDAQSNTEEMKRRFSDL